MALLSQSPGVCVLATCYMLYGSEICRRAGCADEGPKPRNLRRLIALHNDPAMSVLYADMQRRCQIRLALILSSAAERVAGMNVPRSPVAWSCDPAHRKEIRWGAVARAFSTLWDYGYRSCCRFAAGVATDGESIDCASWHGREDERYQAISATPERFLFG